MGHTSLPPAFESEVIGSRRIVIAPRHNELLLRDTLIISHHG